MIRALALLSDLRAARLVFNDAREEVKHGRHIPFGILLELGRTVGRLVRELIGEDTFLLRPRRPSLADHVQVTISIDDRWAEPRERMRVRREVLKTHAPERWSRDPDMLVFQRKRIDVEVEDRMMVWHATRTIEQNIRNAIFNTPKIPYTDQGIAFVRAVIIESLHRSGFSGAQVVPVPSVSGHPPFDLRLHYRAIAPAGIHPLVVDGTVTVT